MREDRTRWPGGVNSRGTALLALAVAGAIAIGALVAAGSGVSPASPDRAVAAPSSPNVLVIESDDQTVESMKAMQNVNSLIGAQGATFKNNFVNYSLCCPSRSTFLTGEYEHNHGVLGNSPPNGGFQRFQALHGDNNLAVWLEDAGYYTGLIGKYLNGYKTTRRFPPDGPSGTRPRPDPGGLRLHAQRQWEARDVRPRRRRLQAGRVDRKGGGLRRSPCAEAEAVLPLADVHGAARRRPQPEPAATRQLSGHGQAGATACARVPLRAAADAPELQRGGRLGQAGRDPAPPAAWRQPDRRHPAQVPLRPRVDPLGRRGRQAAGGCPPGGRGARQHADHLHVRQRLLPWRAPDPERQDAHLRGVDPGAARDAWARASRKG